MNSQIRELTNLDDFKKAYKAFFGPPYRQSYTEEELEEIFREYQQTGYIYGAYNEDGCIGLIALERGVKEDQPVSFQTENVMYLADIAILEPYRRRGLGSQLMLYGVIQSKAWGYEKLYMRTLQDGSMSYGIASRIGFRQIPNVLQDVERKTIDGSVKTMQDIFLELDLTSLDRETLTQGIRMAASLSKDDGREGRD